ncbi:DUF421 domain-containing protein [Flavobacterium suaedae]|uniref:DUF421 domain-containing protein n=1 Tax=Flavobacterium suaedae TaxID=1767027 RepID=A0ABQ1JVJ9_9FLAO|nr:YetF domain-containing protein [Flavobacterium suaedae]GGB75826.1 DUF421 domain-containing protein [Flavobacterium suaedae]
MNKIFFDNWESIARTLIITVMAYITLIVMLRVSGKRTLSKMNAFDFIITIALGSAFATVTLNKSVALIDGILVFFLLVFLQYSITWLSVRNKSVKKLITSRPTLLLYKGELLNEVLKKERVTIEEIYVAARQHGISSLDTIDVIILETAGEITVIPKIESNHTDALENVRHYH